VSISSDPRLSKHVIREDILATPAFVRRFDPHEAREVADALEERGGLLVVGEGSSRIFPGRRAIVRAIGRAWPEMIATAGCREAREMPLASYAVLALSRSGKTREVRDLVAHLEETDHGAFFTMGELDERAFPSTRSVVGEALLVDAVFDARLAEPLVTGKGPRERLASGMERIFDADVSAELTDPLAAAERIWLCGRDDGVAEELALKCCELARKPAAFLEGTRLLHGLQAVIGPKDALVLVDPFPEEAERMVARAHALGAAAVAIADAPQAGIPTLACERSAGLDGYLQLAAGWSLLVALGLHLGKDLDGADLRLP